MAEQQTPTDITPEGIAQACENSFNWLMHGRKTGPCIAAPQFAEAARLLRLAPHPDILTAAQNLLDAVDARQDNCTPPLKYTIPYGAVNDLRAAIQTTGGGKP